MSQPLLQSDLDQLAATGSDCPRCTQHHAKTFHPPTPCHPKLNLATMCYTKDTGVVEMKCFLCGKTVLAIKVATS